ncbi:MAG: hypothetical protein R3E58_15450 [Phycisphaerae bacterium]
MVASPPAGARLRIGRRTYKELITPGTTNSLGDIGVPYERMIETANAAGMDAWICIPHAASDDYDA